MTTTNTNCLVGWKCPDCGHTESFAISVQISATVIMADNGHEETIEMMTQYGNNSIHYDNDSWASCRGCGKQADVAYFTGGDDDA